MSKVRVMALTDKSLILSICNLTSYMTIELKMEPFDFGNLNCLIVNAYRVSLLVSKMTNFIILR